MDLSNIQFLIAKFHQRNWWPAYKQSYDFTTDWFTYRIAKWKKFLSYLKGRENLLALEIGTFEGRSALWLLENILTASSARLVCIDPFLGKASSAKDVFLSNLELGGYQHKTEVIAGFSQDVLPEFKPEQFDLIYIDGNHEGEQILSDAKMCWALLKPSGLLIFDDYKWPARLAKGLSPRQGIDQFLKRYATELQIIYKDYQVFVRKK